MAQAPMASKEGNDCIAWVTVRGPGPAGSAAASDPGVGAHPRSIRPWTSRAADGAARLAARHRATHGPTAVLISAAAISERGIVERDEPPRDRDRVPRWCRLSPRAGGARSAP